MQKRLLSLALALTLVAQLLSVVAVAEDMNDNSPLGTCSGNSILGLCVSSFPVVWNGTTETKPQQDANSVYQIATAAELAWFRTHVNTAKPCASDAVLTADIDLGNHNWTPISAISVFSDLYTGTFDGQGHTVSGLSVYGEEMYQGLFGQVNGATIKNLSVEGGVSGKKNYVGGIVGSTRNATIENCSFSGRVTTTGNYAGGIIGGNQGTPSTISGCVNMADVTGGTVGGIMGHSTQKNTIENCYNAGAITGSIRSGGIVGHVTAGTITNCYNIGEIAGSSFGGIYGVAGSSVTTTNCYRLMPDADEPGEPKYSAAKSTKISSPTDPVILLEKLNGSTDAFVDDNGANSGYPMLSWQAPPDMTPSISLNGATTIYVQADKKPNGTTLSIGLKNITADEIDSAEWTVATEKSGVAAADIVDWQTADNDDKQLVVTAKKGGIVTVTAEVVVGGETLTATRNVSVIPQITTAQIVNVNDPGAVAMGQTVEVKVTVLGGGEYDYENYPTLTYQWRCKPASLLANNINGATARTFNIPTDAGYSEWDSLSVQIVSGGAVVQEASKELRSADYGTLYPVAYDLDFTLPNKVKDNTALVLPATRTVGGLTADITWTSGNAAINAATGAVTRPASGKIEVTLTARYTYGTAFANKTFTVTVYSEQAAQEENNKSYLQQAADSLGEWYGPIAPVYGKDTSIAEMLREELVANGYDDLSIAVKSVTERHDGAGVAPDGEVTYFYADPNGSRGLWFGQHEVTFTLSREGDTIDVEDVMVNLYWDKSKVEQVMRSEVLSGVTEQVILAANNDRDNVMSNLELPKVVSDKKWTQVEWSSSDPSAVVISKENQGSANTLFNPYVGKVIRGEEDKEVTLTAKFNFQRTTANEPPIVMYKTFTFTVKALTGVEVDAIRTELMNKLNAGFDAVGLCDYITGERLTEVDGIYTAANDLQLPTTRDFGVDGKYFPITITSSDDSTLAVPDVANAARVTVYRPMVGDATQIVKLTVSITDLARGISASKNFTIEVTPLVQAELDDALALMDRVKTAYFDGINQNRYADDFSITGGLRPFQEAVWSDTESGLRWIYDSRDTTKNGIVADELDNWAEQEAWRAFRSSDMELLDNETLNYVTKPAEDTFVRINSMLTHEVYGKYAQKSGYEGFEQLYKQPVAVYVMVEGKNHPSRTRQELEQMRDEAIARIGTPISAGFTLRGTRPQNKVRGRSVVAPLSSDVLIETTVSKLEAGTTVFGLFRKALAEQGYTYKAVGSYVKSVTDADGNALSERDNGPNSGWIYTVNGKMPSIYMNGYSLKEDDEVVVRFTDDYTLEGGLDNGGGDKDDESNGDKGEISGGGSENPANIDKNSVVNFTEEPGAPKDKEAEQSSEADGAQQGLSEDSSQAVDGMAETLLPEGEQDAMDETTPKPYIFIVIALALVVTIGVVYKQRGDAHLL